VLPDLAGEVFEHRVVEVVLLIQAFPVSNRRRSARSVRRVEPLSPYLSFGKSSVRNERRAARGERIGVGAQL
jgi:hypothetical protein